MAIPPSNFPVSIWDGFSKAGRNRINDDTFSAPDGNDYERLASEIIGLQKGGLLVALQDSDFSIGIESASVQLVNTIDDDLTVSLAPAKDLKHRVFNIKKTDPSEHSIIIDPNGSETIDGETTAVISQQYLSLTIISDGNKWHVI